MYRRLTLQVVRSKGTMQAGLCLMLWLQLFFLKGVCGKERYNPMTFPTDASSTAECLTEKRQPGVCLLLEDCPLARDAIATGRNPKVCYWKGMVPVVCCPSKTKPTSIPTPTPASRNPDNEREVFTFDGGAKECGVKMKPGRPGFYSKTVEESISRLPKINDSLSRALQQAFRNIKRAAITDEQDNWSWMVAIFSTAETGQVHICGGVLIPSGRVLTTAHCFLTRSTKPSDYVVRVGGSSLYEGFLFAVESITIHPDFRSNMNYNDLAILKLIDDTSTINRIIPICLPSVGANENELVRQSATVLGWDDVALGEDRSPQLQSVQGLPIVPTRDCNATYFNLSIAAFQKGIGHKFICAGMANDRREVPCQDDSGGPLLIQINGRWTLLGLVSFGYGCAIAEYPAVYTRVSSYVDWIQRHQERFSREVEGEFDAVHPRGKVYPEDRVIFS